MSAFKIIVLLGAAVVVVGAFIEIPYAALIITLLGLAAGWFISSDAENIRIRFMVSLLVLFVITLDGDSLSVIPAIGTYLDTILGNLSSLYNAAGVTVVVMGFVNRIRGM